MPILVEPFLLCMNEDMSHLFLKCDFFGRLWCLISNWLGFVTVIQGFFLTILAVLLAVRLSMNIISLSIASFI